jgi:hypothetical protein
MPPTFLSYSYLYYDLINTVYHIYIIPIYNMGETGWMCWRWDTLTKKKSSPRFLFYVREEDIYLSIYLSLERSARIYILRRGGKEGFVFYSILYILGDKVREGGKV